MGYFIIAGGLKLVINEFAAARNMLTVLAMAGIVCLCFSEPLWKKLTITLGVVAVMMIPEMAAVFLLAALKPLEWGELFRFGGLFETGLVLVNGIMFLLLVKYYDACRGYTANVAYLGMGITVMGMAIDLIIMYFIENMKKKVEAEERYSQLYAQRQYELNYYKMTNQYLEEMRVVRHEFQNQLQTAYIMMEQGQQKEKIHQILERANQQLKGNEEINVQGDNL